jgi:hypothetical protein
MGLRQQQRPIPRPKGNIGGQEEVHPPAAAGEERRIPPEQRITPEIFRFARPVVGTNRQIDRIVTC